jgi:hypothetical protein
MRPYPPRGSGGFEKWLGREGKDLFIRISYFIRREEEAKGGGGGLISRGPVFMYVYGRHGRSVAGGWAGRRGARFIPRRAPMETTNVLVGLMFIYTS